MADESQFSLLKQRRFGPFFITQFLGAFNDNVFKNALVILIAFKSATSSVEDSNYLVNLSAGLFILPFFLFSATAGQFADKFEKSRLIRYVKLLEIIIMAGAAIGFYLGNVPLLIGLLFLMGAQSTLFGPVKYGILPQHLREDELVGGNGLVEMGTFLAILLGTMLGGILIGLDDGASWIAGTVVVLAVLGFLGSLRIPAAEPTDPALKINWNPITETWRIAAFARQNRTVFLSILGISWFWLVGATYLAQLPNYSRLTLGGNEQVVTLLLTVFSLGIGLGSLLCERLSGHKVELGLVPFGSIGITVFGVDLFFAAPHADHVGELLGMAGFLQGPGHWRVLVDIGLIGLFGGFFIVPLYALIQQRSAASHRSRIIAGNNILNAFFMVLSAVLAIILLNHGFSIPQLFFVMALFNAAVAVYIYTLVPEFLMRFIVWLMVNTMYRLRSEGLEHIPDEGAAVLVCNHVSFMDALVIAGCCRRPLRFVMDHRIFKIPVLNFVFRTAGAVPIAPAREDPVMLERAYERIAEYLDAGDVVCIFPEGKITADGELSPFRSGIERIIQRNPAPVIPMALRGLWGSFFSRKGGPAMLRMPRRFWSKIALAVGVPVAPEQANAPALQTLVGELRGDWK
ncbi:MAG: MFS transporter [Gammaproteobacteria bacterium]|nr:MFS transporter [Gammaproteobacteria bacterium]MCP5423556.1 MFS transporter [Gammaproteobacteria bacterium]